MMRRFFIAIVILLVLSGLFGCSAGGSEAPVTPPQDSRIGKDSFGGHITWGLWEFTIDPVNELLDAVQLRNGNLHMNALPFLEPPALLHLTVESIQFNGNEIYAEIGLRHPFLGLTQFTGFDVAGILISDGTVTGFDDAEIKMAGDGDPHLMNSDGYTRWWNPEEFPINNGTIFSYTDGLLGTPDSEITYNSTINGYKFFCDDFVSSDSQMDSLDPASRCQFSAGQKNVRMYRIKFFGDLVFNYAVDASWHLPVGSPPWSAPDDFPLSANRPEAWHVTTTVTENTLYNDGNSSGGSLSLSIDVWDHQNADLNTVKVESPGNFTIASSSTPIGGGDGYSTYQIDITGATPEPDGIDLLITVESDETGYQQLLPGKPVSAYFTDWASVSDGTPTSYTLEWTDEARIEYSNVDTRDEFEPAICRRPNGTLYIAFIQVWHDNPGSGHRYNFPREATSTDNGQTFSYASHLGYWDSHGGYTFSHNSKLTAGPDGYLFLSYNDPPGHTLGRVPLGLPYPQPDYGCHTGVWVEHAGEMLYTSEGYPMMFGDSGGNIRMRRGDIPNIAGTGTWPSFQGTQYIDIPNAWLSLSRSTGLTSDGTCRLMYWNDSGEIHLLSSDDISGTAWNNDQTVFNASDLGWDDVRDPGFWVDDYDIMHATFLGYAYATAGLVYGKSADGFNFGFEEVTTANTSLITEDTQVATVTAFDEEFVFLVYKNVGVLLQWKMEGEAEFSGTIPVNEHLSPALPDMYPNGANGLTIVYQATGDNGNTDIFFRTCTIVEVG